MPKHLGRSPISPRETTRFSLSHLAVRSRPGRGDLGMPPSVACSTLVSSLAHTTKKPPSHRAKRAFSGRCCTNSTRPLTAPVHDFTVQGTQAAEELSMFAARGLWDFYKAAENRAWVGQPHRTSARVLGHEPALRPAAIRMRGIADSIPKVSHGDQYFSAVELAERKGFEP